VKDVERWIDLIKEECPSRLQGLKLQLFVPNTLLRYRTVETFELFEKYLFGIDLSEILFPHVLKTLRFDSVPVVSKLIYYLR
jgi:hypothetical protein